MLVCECDGTKRCDDDARSNVLGPAFAMQRNAVPQIALSGSIGHLGVEAGANDPGSHNSHDQNTRALRDLARPTVLCGSSHPPTGFASRGHIVRVSDDVTATALLCIVDVLDGRTPR